MMVFDADDFGCDHIISDMCQSHDCRDVLTKFKKANPEFKITLFAIPTEMTMELLQWCATNSDWVELGTHGFRHDSNYECEKWTYEQMDNAMSLTAQLGAFTRLFKAPGWQISDECFRWLADHDWMIADQAYNNERRPKELRAYVNNNGQFSANDIEYEGHHFHTWNCVGNGLYEEYDNIIELIGKDTEFKFVSEIIYEAYSNEK